MENESCCPPKKEYKGDSIWKGIAYGLIPHTGCILFIIGAVLGATVLMQFFRPLLMNRWIFHYLILISIGFATFSSFLYLRKNKSLSIEGIKKKKGYLSMMYGSVVGINLLLFIFVFPFIANITGNVSAEEVSGLSMLSISVDIPCPGHAPLISNEVKTIEGVKGSEYSFPNDFEVYYDESKTSKDEILALEVFEEYPATVLDEEVAQSYSPTQTAAPAGSCSGGCGGPGTCGGSCGSPTCGYNG
ncbi:hypothetical protein GOV13_00180 [Candidatus Pacearchaeota archaeon]|nr:hypothetical protein [Candidatus Pacearchaeota archaeon]